MKRKRILFIGGGHANIYPLWHADTLIKAGADVTLVSPFPYHYYSGMGPGLLSEMYAAEETRFDLQSLITRRGGTFIRAAVSRVLPKTNQVELATGERLVFDYACFNVGSRVRPFTKDDNISLRVKPIQNFGILQRMLSEWPRERHGNLAIIGGGAAGVETAGNAQKFADTRQLDLEIHLILTGGRLLNRFSEQAGRLAEKKLRKRNIQLHLNATADKILEHKIRFADQSELQTDIVVLATGIRPSPIFCGSSLHLEPDMSMRVNQYLQSVDAPNIFGSGDCITFVPRPLDRVGVYAVRQGPVLFKNLLALLNNEPLTPFKPQKSYLLIFNLGDGTGLMVKNRWALAGKWIFKLKDHIDRSFIQKFS